MRTSIHMLSCILACLMLLGLPLTAHAAASQVPALQLDSCAPGYQDWDFTTKVVACVQNSIITATMNMMSAVSQYMTPIVSVALVLALVIFGIRILGGERQLSGKAVGFSMRAGIVWMMYYNLGGIAPTLFGIEQELVTLSTQAVGAPQGWSPWQQIDTFLGNLFGFGPNILLSQGLVSLISGSFFSSTLGIWVFLIGVIAIINLLMFIFNIVYSYLTALLVLGFLLITSPLIIPLGLFFTTERYVRKWLDILMSTMLMPVILFAFLWMFLGIFDVLIGNMYNIVVPPGTPPGINNVNFTPYQKINQSLFAWLTPNEPNRNQEQERNASTVMPGQANNPNIQNIPAVQTNINPFMHNALNMNSFFMFPAVDFGATNPQMSQQFTFSLFALALFAFILNSMMTIIPHISSNIAGIITRVPMFSTSPMERIREAKENIATGAGALTGAEAARQGQARLGATQSKRSGMFQEMGAAVGGALGGFFGRRI